MDDTLFKTLLPPDAKYVKKLCPKDVQGTDINITRHPYGIFSVDGSIEKIAETKNGAECAVKIEGGILLTLH